MKKLSTALVIMISIMSCGNDDSPFENQRTLPPITQTGANTFGCYIDQLLFLPRDGDGTFGSNDRAVYFKGGYPNPLDYNEIDIHDYKSEKTASLLIHIQALNTNSTGDYIINESNGLSNIDGLSHNYIHCRVWREDIGNYQNYLSYENSGIITITNYNLSDRLVSGTFSGYVRNYQEPHDTIQITQGRFDFKWDTLDETDFP